MAPSACVWAGGKRTRADHLRALLSTAIRAPDPHLVVHGSWLVRRLAADCSKIDLAHLARDRDESRLLWAMGFETANVHLGTEGARAALRTQSRELDAQALRDLSRELARATQTDLRAWRKARRR